MEAITHSLKQAQSVDSACPACGRPIARSGKFCGHCGARLWEPCLKCQAANSVVERFCAQCGTDLPQALAEMSQRLDDVLQAASVLEAEGRLLEAIEQLASAPASSHSALAARTHEVVRLREELTEKRRQIIANLDERLAEARRLHDQRRYAQAAQCLERIPSSLRNREMRTLLAEIQVLLQEIVQLRATIRERLKRGQVDQLLGPVERLHDLDPHATDVERLWRQLSARQRERDAAMRRHQLKEARDAVLAGDYARAEACLRKLPGPVEDQGPCDALWERVWLARQIARAPFADRNLLAVATRLTKLQPSDAIAAQWLAKIRERLARAGEPGDVALVPWTRSAPASRFTAPVEPWTMSMALARQGDGPGMAWGQTSRRYLTCFGLALVGLNRAEIDLDLRAERSLLARWSESRPFRRPVAAWGIEMAATGLKFVKLAVQKDQQLEVAAAGTVAYPSTPALSDGENITVQAAAAIAAFIEQHPPGDAPCVVGLPGTQSLNRFFRLPVAKRDRKFAAALEFEVRNQIPLPLDEVLYATHACSDTSQGDQSPPATPVSLVAAKRVHVQMRLGPFLESKFRVASLQSDGVALANALHFAYGEQLASLSADESWALVDVGETATNVVVASRGGFCFRTIHQGTRQFERAVAQALGVTRRQARELCTHWERAEAMFRLDAALAPALEQLTRAVAHALTAGAETLGTTLGRVLVAGGGCYQFGLLRDWSRPQELDDEP